MAGATGLEPAASGVTGRRYNQLNYAPICDLKEASGEPSSFEMTPKTLRKNASPVKQSLTTLEDKA